MVLIIRCCVFNEIHIGEFARIVYEVQICDMAFHYISVSEEKPIVIKNNVWIGNRSTISKRTYLPAYSIVAQGILVNKSFLEAGKGIFIAGMPAS